MSIRLGRHSYGSPKINDWTRNSVVNVGAFCSITDSTTFVIDGNHKMDSFSTFPFQIILPGFPSSNWGKETPSVGNDVWIADDAVIHSGVHIGDGAVVSGQSVVTKSVPPYAVVAGNPARIVKYRFDEETVGDLLKLKWWDLPDPVIINELLPLYSADIGDFIVKLREIRAQSEYSQ